jgi:hypothetical protein
VGRAKIRRPFVRVAISHHAELRLVVEFEDFGTALSRQLRHLVIVDASS